MKFHWYEDYWCMPRNLPVGHDFFIGYYQDRRAIRFRCKNIHTDQTAVIYTELFALGYRVFFHFKSGSVVEAKLGENECGQTITPYNNLERMLLAAVFGRFSE